MSRDQTQALAAVPRSARFAVVVLFFLTGVTFASWAARIPAVQTRLGLSPGQLGVALLAIAAGELVSMNLAGYLAARFGSRSVTVIASVSLSVMLPILVLVLLPAHADAQRAGVAFARPTRTLLALGLIAFCVLLGEGAMADWSAVYLNTTLRTP